MNTYTIEYEGVKIHINTEKEVKDYLDRLGKMKVKVVQHKVVFERTLTHIKVDRL